MCVKNLSAVGAEGDMTPELFLKLAPIFPGLESLILTGLGEPLLNPHLEEFVRIGRAHMPEGATIAFQSNGVLLDAERAAGLLSAGLTKLCISLDSTDPAVYSDIRGGAELAWVERAFASVATAKRLTGREISLGLEFVALRDNIEDLPDLLGWAAERGASFAIVTQCLPYDLSVVPEVAYDQNTDRAVDFFLPWKERAVMEGIDLGRYFAILWKYHKTPEDLAIVDFVERMKADAASRDVFINIQALLGRDEAWFARVRAVFAEAAARAAELGISLALPEVLPRGARKCEFVENDGMFVSFDGGVHPCYFLWHEYRSFVNGREKFVTPKVFGNIASQDPLELWNAIDFKQFRESVRRYDYPFCSDCNLGKCCDYIQAEEFQQDCFLNQEPCGDCLWCKGVFHCLQV